VMRLVRSCLENLRGGLFLEINSLGRFNAFGVSRDHIVLSNKWCVGYGNLYYVFVIPGVGVFNPITGWLSHSTLPRPDHRDYP